MSSNSTKQIASGMFWKMMERICAQGVSFVVSLILARMLAPDDYGVIAMILVFINLANVFVSNGFSAALIQKKDADELDFSTMFYCSVIISIFMYLILYCGAPIIASFYDEPSLVWLLRVLGFKLIINAANSIQHAYISRKMQFKKFFFSTSIGTAVSAVVGIVMAICGAGAWALVAQYLVNSVISMLVLFVTVDWKPRKLFSVERAKSLLAFGWKVTIADFVATAYNEMRSLVIGKFYTASDLAYYNKSDQFPKLFVNNIMTTVSAVLFPALANISDSKDKVRQTTRVAIRMTCYIIFPLMAGMIVVAEPLVRLLLTEKWLPTVPFLQIACISYAILPLNNTNVQAIKAMGEGNTYLAIELIKKILGIIVISLAACVSVNAVAVSAVVIAFVYLVINILPNGKFLDYGFLKQLKDVLPFLLMSVSMGGIVWIASLLPIESDLAMLIIQTLTGCLVYVVLSLIFKIREFTIVIDLAKKFLKKKAKS